MIIFGKKKGLTSMNYKTKMLPKEVKIKPRGSRKKETIKRSMKWKPKK